MTECVDAVCTLCEKPPATPCTSIIYGGLHRRQGRPDVGAPPTGAQLAAAGTRPVTGPAAGRRRSKMWPVRIQDQAAGSPHVPMTRQSCLPRPMPPRTPCGRASSYPALSPTPTRFLAWLTWPPARQFAGPICKIYIYICLYYFYFCFS